MFSLTNWLEVSELLIHSVGKSSDQRKRKSQRRSGKCTLKKTWLVGFLRADENIKPIKTGQTCRLTFYFSLSVFKSNDFMMHLSMSLYTTQINQSALKVVGVSFLWAKPSETQRLSLQIQCRGFHQIMGMCILSNQDKLWQA